MKRIIIDLDGTLTMGVSRDYASATPNEDVIARLREYKQSGFEVAVYTSRNMRTYKDNLGRIIARTTPVIIDWLERHGVPFDELWVGKPWCGHDGFYVDDRAVRPREFVDLDYDAIRMLIGAGPEVSPDE